MTCLKSIRFVRKIGAKSRGFLCTPTWNFACAIGRSGLKRDKREGDGATPYFALPLREVYYKHIRPRTKLKAIKIHATMAWCDEVQSANYNKLMRSSQPLEESLLRQDTLYDYVIVLGWNDRPVRKNKGSAIFWHIAREGFAPTAGCYATRPESFKLLLPRVSCHTKIIMINAL
jgi:L,D-peptidoglycan transpeptidase YkuD (ErfK/YbiS/YcfS/YnhG family)